MKPEVNDKHVAEADLIEAQAEVAEESLPEAEVEAEVAAPGESKPGIKTTELAVTAGSILLLVLDVIPLQEKSEGKYAALIAIAYIIARGLAKAGVPYQK